MQNEPRKVREFRRREQEILDTALQLFLEQGEDSVTVEMIADRADDLAMLMSLEMGKAVAEAKGEGYDVKVLRKVIRIRKQDKAKRQEEEAILDLYLSALGEI